MAADDATLTAGRRAALAVVDGGTMGRTEKTSIYLIGPADRSRVKIGLSKDPKRRLRQLQTGSAERLEIIDLLPGGPFVERQLQYNLRDMHLGGEWFSGGPEFFLSLGIAFRAILHVRKLELSGQKVEWRSEPWSCRTGSGRHSR